MAAPRPDDDYDYLFKGARPPAALRTPRGRLARSLRPPCREVVPARGRLAGERCSCSAASACLACSPTARRVRVRSGDYR